MTKFKVVLALGIALLLSFTSSSPVSLGHGGLNFEALTEEANFLDLDVPSDISCSLTVEVDLDQNFNPIINKETACDNVLEFVSTSDLEITIVKEDHTFPSTVRSQAVLEALGLFVDRNSPETRCTFYDKKGRVRINPKPFLNVGAVLRDAPPNDLWFDPQGGGTQSFTLMNKPGKSRIFDCRFKMDFFLDPDQLVAIAAGTYELSMNFIVSTDADEGCDEDSDDEDGSGDDGDSGDDDDEGGFCGSDDD